VKNEKQGAASDHETTAGLVATDEEICDTRQEFLLIRPAIAAQPACK
jgi:hypothetical protein